MSIDRDVLKIYTEKCEDIREHSLLDIETRAGIVKEIKSSAVCALCANYVPVAVKDYCCGEKFSVIDERTYKIRFDGGYDYDNI